MIETHIAGPSDEADIARLLARNSPSAGGSLSGEWDLAGVSRWHATGGSMLLARSGQHLAGVVLVSAPDPLQSPPITALLKAYAPTPNAYLYGPVCVAAEFRGTGVTQRLWAELGRLYPGREAVLFIRKDNQASLRVHIGMGFSQVGTFELDGLRYFIFSSQQSSR